MTTGLTITDSVVSSLNSGATANLHIIATSTTGVAPDTYQLQWSVYEDSTKAVQVTAIFKDNKQIIQLDTVELTPGTEPSRTALLQALKTKLETDYGWTITEVVE